MKYIFARNIYITSLKFEKKIKCKIFIYEKHFLVKHFHEKHFLDLIKQEQYYQILLNILLLKQNFKNKNTFKLRRLIIIKK